MAGLSSDLLKEVTSELEVLIAVGLYKTRSEQMKDYLSKLSARYKGHLESIEEVREALDKRLKGRALSEEIREIMR